MRQNQFDSRERITGIPVHHRYERGRLQACRSDCLRDSGQRSPM
jgi:hypothetical protein